MTRCALFLFLIALFTAQSAPEVEITAEPHHHAAFANDQVRVFNIEVPAHGETLMHWHRHDYIGVSLGTTEVMNSVKGKDPITVKMSDGDTRFIPGGFAHTARNLSDQPFHYINVEFLQDEKLRKARAKWDEDRGLDILHGGTKEILFVKDGVRVTEFELQPGGMVPMHRHAGPHLLVAVSDLDLREHFSNDVHPNEMGQMKSGDSKWINGGYSHMLTNAGKQPAKWITLEFP